MFIEQAFKAKHEFWRYLVGSLIIGTAAVLGQMLVVVAFIFKFISEGKGLDELAKLDESNMFKILDSNLLLFLLMFSFVLALLAIILVLKTIHQQKLKSIITTRKRLDWKRIWFAFLFWGLLSSGLVLLDFFYLNPDDYAVNFKLNKFIILAIIAIVLIPVQTSVEELVFRGYLMQGFGLLAKNRWFPLLMTSLIFGLLHIGNPEVAKLGYSTLIFYIGTGLFLGILTLMDEGMELALGFHAANNLFIALLVTSDYTAIQTESILKEVVEPEVSIMDSIVPVFILFPILIFIFAKVYKWKNWKEKLFGKIKEPPIENDKIIVESIN